MVSCFKGQQSPTVLERHLSEDLRGVWLTNIDSDILFDANRTKEALIKLKILALQRFIQWFGTMDTRYIQAS